MMGQIDPYKLSRLAQEWDPTPFLQATEGAGGAMDMSGSAASPAGAVQPQQGMDMASIFGMAPQGAPAPNPVAGAPKGGMAPLPQGMMQQFTQPLPMAHPAPAVAPHPAGMIQMPGVEIPRGLKPVPSLAQILSGRT